MRNFNLAELGSAQLKLVLDPITLKQTDNSCSMYAEKTQL